jgi:hypothetical protein
LGEWPSTIGSFWRLDLTLTPTLGPLLPPGTNLHA